MRLVFWIGRGFVCRLTMLRFSTMTFGPSARVDDAALLAAVLAAQHVDEVALTDTHGVGHLEHLRRE
jgi:hypothetical protein